mmetsp:Transcript_25942/g.24791  ORF Transcript_25942/g.24791 Transcript_25942/m.24791 type:complete len:384 (-) Transcript_25942:253-1404(-)
MVKLSLIIPCFLIINLFSSWAFNGVNIFSKSSMNRTPLYMAASTTEWPDLEKCLYKEYTSFFTTFDRSFYMPDVAFLDPITKFTGIDKYKNNIDLIAGRTGLGKFLFEDASIVLHNIVQTGVKEITTRWTLQVTFKGFPWAPRAKFTGVSVYAITDDGKVAKQDDYWDSINLKKGKYEAVSIVSGLSDLADQLKKEASAEMSAPEMPYELLRRGSRYEVRRYPSSLVAETVYDQRPEGYDRLGSYAGGSNVKDARVPYYSPTLMRIKDVEGQRIKSMSWPLVYNFPGRALPDISTIPEPTIPRVNILERPGLVVAVTRFELAATEPIVRGFTGQLLSDIKEDGMTATEACQNGDCIVGQYDAIFSLNKRRNEVWVVLEDHMWK